MHATLQVLKRSAAWIACAGLALVLAPACTEKGRSLVLVDIDAEPTLMDLKKVTIIAWKGTSKVGSNPFEWTGADPHYLSVYVSKSVTGSVTVTAEGFNTAGKKIAESMSMPIATAEVQPGEASKLDMTLHLEPWMAPPDGGAGGSSGSGGGGSGGVGGNGTDAGTGGTDAGTGGTDAGTGGTDAGAGGTDAGTGGTDAGTGGAPGPGWRGAKLVEADVVFDDWNPSVAVDASGNAVVAYRHGPGIRASRYTATAGWATPAAVDARSGGQAYAPALAVDKNGRWLVIWQQDEHLAFPGIWQSTSTDGITWSAPGKISTAAGFFPELAMNRDGAAVAAWSSKGPSGTNVVAASVRTSATGTWSPPTERRPSNSNVDLIAKVAMSGLGEAFVVWDDYDGQTVDFQDSIWLRRFSANTWKPATLMESYDAGPSTSPNVAANTAGQAIVIWEQHGAVSELWAATFSALGAQAASALVVQATSIPDPPPSVTVDEAGVATIAWAMRVQGKYNVHTSRAAAGQPWPAAMAMETDNQADMVSNQEQVEPAPLVQTDGAGNVVLVWRKRVGATRFDLWSRRFSGGAWAPATLLETDDAAVGGVSFPALGVGTSGVAATAWYYIVADSDPTTNRIWANVWR